MISSILCYVPPYVEPPDFKPGPTIPQVSNQIDAAVGISIRLCDGQSFGMIISLSASTCTCLRWSIRFVCLSQLGFLRGAIGERIATQISALKGI